MAGAETTRTRVAPMLAVGDGSAAVAFCGAVLLWRIGEGADVVGGLEID